MNGKKLNNYEIKFIQDTYNNNLNNYQNKKIAFKKTQQITKRDYKTIRKYTEENYSSKKLGRKMYSGTRSIEIDNFILLILMNAQ